LNQAAQTCDQVLVDPNPAGRARKLRREQTDAEKRLWSRLRDHRLGVKFRRQFPIGPFVADFCCHECRLIIEIDGEQHAANASYDERRTAFLGEQGYRVLRFWNHEIMADTERVLAQIFDLLKNPQNL